MANANLTDRSLYIKKKISVPIEHIFRTFNKKCFKSFCVECNFQQFTYYFPMKRFKTELLQDLCNAEISK